MDFLNDWAASTPGSVSYSVIAFWNGRKLLHPGFIVFPDKNLLAGDLGPVLGGAMSLVVEGYEHNLENYQTADGEVVIPEVLRPYMAGIEKISK